MHLADKEKPWWALLPREQGTFPLLFYCAPDSQAYLGVSPPTCSRIGTGTFIPQVLQKWTRTETRCSTYTCRRLSLSVEQPLPLRLLTYGGDTALIRSGRQMQKHEKGCGLAPPWGAWAACATGGERKAQRNVRYWDIVPVLRRKIRQWGIVG